MSLPALRFKEFNGVWKNRPLSEIIGRLESGVSVNSEDSPITGFHEYGILKTSCIADGYFIEQENKKIIPIDISRAKLNPNEDTILVSRMNTPLLVGEVGYVTKSYPNLFVPDRLWLIEVKNKSRDSTKWLSQQLTTKKLKSALTNIASGTSGSMKNIAQPNFLKIELSTPEFNEQTKIANFLTAVDEKITQLTQKHDLLIQYKKGVMQQIFSQELRFKDDDGQDFPEWEDFLLKDALIKNSRKNKNGEFKLVQSVSNKHGFINQDELFEGRVIASKDLSNYYIIKKSAFAYNPSRIDVGSLAYKSDDLTSVVSPLYVSFYSKPNLINDSYLFNWFDTEQFKNQMNGSFEGSVRNTLSYDSLSKISVALPSLKEQTKIANFLTAVDEKITVNQTQLQAVKQYKQGLLQQMFV